MFYFTERISTYWNHHRTLNHVAILVLDSRESFKTWIQVKSFHFDEKAFSYNSAPWLLNGRPPQVTQIFTKILIYKAMNSGKYFHCSMFCMHSDRKYLIIIMNYIIRYHSLVGEQVTLQHFKLHYRKVLVNCTFTKFDWSWYVVTTVHGQSDVAGYIISKISILLEILRGYLFSLCKMITTADHIEVSMNTKGIQYSH